MTHLAPDCWNVTGTDGDRSCTRLAEMIHCGNCPTRSGMGRTLFDRVAPDEYLREWSAALQAERERGLGRSKSHVIFRLEDQFFAFLASGVSMIVPARSFHRLPTCSNALVHGLANLRGELRVVLSLTELLHLEEAAASESLSGFKPTGFYLVFVDGRSHWTFHVDDILAVEAVEHDALLDAPLTVERHRHSFSTKVFLHHGKAVALLDTVSLIDELSRRFA